ncbi:MAG: nuclear transport factor 2 family protein [Desulfobacterium sp.]|nr:nuclear transport factor 2 family protein [Desulfobacterium sp.]
MHKSIIEIEQLLYRCCHAVDQRNIDNIMSVFHPNATLIINWEETGKYSGHEEIRQWFFNYTQVMKSAVKYLRHKITCPVIEVNGDEATAFSYLDVDAAPKDASQVIITVCRYEDKFTKLDGQWYLKEKSIFMDDTYTIMK